MCTEIKIRNGKKQDVSDKRDKEVFVGLCAHAKNWQASDVVGEEVNTTFSLDF